MVLNGGMANTAHPISTDFATRLIGFLGFHPDTQAFRVARSASSVDILI